ncbi:MAG: glycosyl transferase [Clostridia bacterium]|nr:glycosyl transferase [Clostridia bacterium]
MSDEKFIRKKYRLRLGADVDIQHPKTFNEKLQWLKLYDRKPIYSTIVDKYAVKDYVSSIIGKDYIVPTFGVWDRFEDIDFESLPNQFVLKCTHDSGGLVIVKDKSKMDIREAGKIINKSLKRNYYHIGREWPYKNVKPRIIAEKYMEDSSTGELRDYKFFCFNGEAKCFKVDFDRFTEHRANYYSIDKKLMKLGEKVCPPDFDRDIRLPASIDQMKILAEKLAASIPFVRVDFYDVDGKIYFGELTFFPDSGFGKFIFEGNTELLGSWIKLPDRDIEKT